MDQQVTVGKHSSPRLTNQWNDFLLRRIDPYATVKYDIILNWMGNLEGKKVLVAGCGSGELCGLVALRGAQVDAFDIEEKNLVLAQETASRLNTSFTTFVAKIESVPTEKKYDFVIATDVIEHIEDDVAAVKQLKALCKPGGGLIITVPALQFLMGYHDEILGHFRRYNASTLLKVVKPGWDIIHLRYFGFFLIPVTLLVSCILRRPYPVAVIGKVTESKSFLSKLLTFFFRMEQKIRFGTGTSLLLMAKSKS